MAGQDWCCEGHQVDWRRDGRVRTGGCTTCRVMVAEPGVASLCGWTNLALWLRVGWRGSEEEGWGERKKSRHDGLIVGCDQGRTELKLPVKFFSLLFLFRKSIVKSEELSAC